MAFPKLYYPELYLLEGGYKAFYEQFPVSENNKRTYMYCVNFINAGNLGVPRVFSGVQSVYTLRVTF